MNFDKPEIFLMEEGLYLMIYQLDRIGHSDPDNYPPDEIHRKKKNIYQLLEKIYKGQCCDTVAPITVTIMSNFD